MSITQADLFTRCGQSLCGPGPRWKEQFAGLLQIQTNTVDNMSKGTSRIPPGVWMEIGRSLNDRLENSGALIQAISAITGTSIEGHSAYQQAMLRDQAQRAGFQTSVRSAPRPAIDAYTIGPELGGISFSTRTVDALSRGIQQLAVGHEFKRFSLVLGGNGAATLEVPHGTSQQAISRFVQWASSIVAEVGLGFDPFRTTNLSNCDPVDIVVPISPARMR
jgi:hypothetical protein